MTSRGPADVRRLARGLGGIALSGVSVAGVGAAGVLVSMRAAFPRPPRSAAESWPPAKPVPNGRLAVAVVLGASGSESIEYPAEQLELAGAGWPWRPTALLALTVTAAIGVALLPAAATRQNRR